MLEAVGHNKSIWKQSCAVEGELAKGCNMGLLRVAGRIPLWHASRVCFIPILFLILLGFQKCRRLWCVCVWLWCSCLDCKLKILLTGTWRFVCEAVLSEGISLKCEITVPCFFPMFLMPVEAIVAICPVFFSTAAAFGIFYPVLVLFIFVE